jgi:hypothetical protein
MGQVKRCGPATAGRRRQGEQEKTKVKIPGARQAPWAPGDLTIVLLEDSLSFAARERKRSTQVSFTFHYRSYEIPWNPYLQFLAVAEFHPKLDELVIC